MYAWNLPTSVQVAGVSWEIRTDFRIVIDCLIAFDNPEYDEFEKWLYCMMSMVVDFDNVDESDYMEMCNALMEFIDMGVEKESKKINIKSMDWEQDANLIIPAVNKVIGHEVRSEKYMHWWTFLSSYMEIDNKSLYSNILSVRIKRQKGKKLDKWEEEFYQENKSLINLKKKLTAEEESEEQLLHELFGV